MLHFFDHFDNACSSLVYGKTLIFIVLENSPSKFLAQIYIESATT